MPCTPLVGALLSLHLPCLLSRSNSLEVLAALLLSLQVLALPPVLLQPLPQCQTGSHLCEGAISA